MDYACIKLAFAAKAFCSRGWRWNNPGSTNYLNLWFVADGVGRLEQADRQYELGAGTCLLIREWVAHAASHDPAHPLTVPFIQFQILDHHGTPFIPNTDALPDEHRVIPEPAMLSGLMDRCVDAWNCDDREGAHHWLVSSLRELERQDTISVGSAEAHQRRVVDRAATLLEENPEHSWSVAKMAAMAGYSPDHFIRLFKKYRGTTPGKYQIRCRIATAMNMLRFTEAPIGEIAEELGYPDIYCFSRQFRKVMGRSPSSFRK